MSETGRNGAGPIQALRAFAQSIFSLLLLLLAQFASGKELVLLTPPAPDEATRVFVSTFIQSPELVQAGLTIKDMRSDFFGSQAEAANALQSGKVALGLLPASAIPGFPGDESLTYTSLLSQPSLAKDAQEQFFLQDSVIGDLMAQEVGRKGLVVLSFWNQPPTSLVARRPLVAASDLKGLKIRASDPQSSAVFASLGANPVTMPLAEVYSALANGAVDASENRIERTLATQQLSALKGGTLVAGFRQSQGFFVSGESSWVALKERERAALREAAKQASSRARSVVVSIEAALPEDARNSGLRFARFDAIGGGNVEANAAAQWLRTAGVSGPQAVTLLKKVKQARPPAPVPRSAAPMSDPVRPQIVFASVRNDEGGTDLSNRFGIARDNSTKLTCGEIQFTSNNARPFGRPYTGPVALASTSARVNAEPCVDLVAEASLQRGGKVVVFIHGYNNTFDTAMRRAIGVGEDLKIDAPIVLWSWPSQGTESGYVYDAMSVEFSRPYFRDFVSALLRNPKVKEITVMAHSMGSRIALQMLEQSAQAQKKLASIVFLAPDVPQTLFSQAIGLYGRGASLATMYANEHDRPLALSEVVNREAPAGLAGNTLFVSDGIETVDLSRLDFEWFGTNHSAGFEIPKAAADVSLVVNRHIKAASRSLTGVTLGKLTYWTIQP